ncbi:MAG: murein biosynthesis integral membrane protein MurJ [Coxiellaceae bacterium]|jgi:putative peptidoglycan lipid II flippase|nr:murein biosynthesis integral membrane protein MurJ [Coxiellaceae bacterium]
MKKSLLKSTFTFSFMTVISRITGLIREIIFAYYFGATAGMDAFNVAYRIPNFLRNLLGEGAFSQAFVPVLSEYREKHSIHEIKVFLNHIAGLMLLVLSIFTTVMVLLAPLLVYIFAPGFINDPTRFGLTTSILRITFPYILFISLTAYVSGILNTYGKFGIPAFAPNLLNLALIGAAVIIAPYFVEPVKALAWGIFVGGAAQLLFQVPYLYKLKLTPQPSILWHDTGVIRVLKLTLPAMFGVSVAQISFLVDNLLASFLRVGSISWLNYSSRLTLFPLGVFGVAIATVVLPYLSRKHAAKSQTEFSNALDWALKFVLIIAIPATIGIAMLAGPIIMTLFNFQYGQFSEFDVTMVRHSLWGFTLGIPAFMLVKVLASGFYSRQNIKTPVKIAIIAMLTNIILATLLVFPLKHAGLALATSLTSLLNASLLFWTIRRDNNYHPGSGWGIFWLRLVFANVTLVLFLWFTNSDDLAMWFGWNSYSRVLHLAILCGGAISIYFLCLWISGMRLREFIMQEK